MSADPVERLPQTGPARLVTRVLDTGLEARCLARIPTNSPFRSRRGPRATVPCLLAIEMAAQSAAVLEPIPDRSASAAGGQRLLVGVRAVRLLVQELDADDEFTCRTTALTLAPPLRIYRFEVSSSSGELVAEGELSTFFDADSGPS